jgi:hypothetical protein
VALNASLPRGKCYPAGTVLASLFTAEVHPSKPAAPTSRYFMLMFHEFLARREELLMADHSTLPCFQPFRGHP